MESMESLKIKIKAFGDADVSSPCLVLLPLVIGLT